jgi:hypothetical protein
MSFRFFSIVLLFILTSCGQAGWAGYYQTYPKTTTNKYIAESVINSTSISFRSSDKVDIELPRGCSGFNVAGIITPFTPPIPLFWFRSWSTSDCHYFTIQTKPQTTVQLKTNNQTYVPEISEALYGYTKYIFPIRAKNIDSGTLIIEKNGEKVEVPFEYKYYKFWY